MHTSDILPEASEAADYLDNALQIMQTNALYRDQIDWARLRNQAYEYSKGAQTPSDTYAAIQFALNQLGDRHSHFLSPDLIAGRRSANVRDHQLARGVLLKGGLGYVLVPAFSSHEAEEVDKFATALQQIIRDVDAGNPGGWIVDLRGNGGGNMWGMLAGIGPILGEGCVGAFVYPDGREWHWYYIDGATRVETWVSAKIKGMSHQLKVVSPHVAVLTGRFTASSGEAIVVAFRGRPNTRSFGEATRGVSTSNQNFPLSDGAMILLTVAIFADRTGQKYGDSIVPDEVVNAQSSEDDGVLDAAVKWLHQSTGM